MFTAIIHAPYILDRPLQPGELAHRLEQEKRVPEQPACQGSVIAMTDEYLDIVDHGYAHKGAIVKDLIEFFVYFVLFLCGGAWYARPDEGYAAGDIEDMLVAFGMLCILLSPLALWLLSKEFFCYTHYPIRFDRVRRTVHVLRRGGSVLSVPWADIFFTLGAYRELNWGVVHGHVLDGDRKTVRKTFTLSHTKPGYQAADDYAPALQWHPDDALRAHWELVRRFMEEGAQAVEPFIARRLPVARRRETFGECRVHIARDRPRLGFGIVPLPLFDAACRWLALRSCRIPRWPDVIPG